MFVTTATSATAEERTVALVRLGHQELASSDARMTAERANRPPITAVGSSPLRQHQPGHRRRRRLAVRAGDGDPAASHQLGEQLGRAGSRESRAAPLHALPGSSASPLTRRTTRPRRRRAPRRGRRETPAPATPGAPSPPTRGDPIRSHACPDRSRISAMRLMPMPPTPTKCTAFRRAGHRVRLRECQRPVAITRAASGRASDRAASDMRRGRRDRPPARKS